MPGDYSKPHLDLGAQRLTNRYKSPPRNIGGGGAPLIREEHGARLRAELNAALAVMDANAPSSPDLPEPDARVIEVQLSPNGRVDSLERRRDGVKPGAAVADENGVVTVALHVPNDARPVLEQILEEYATGELSPAGAPPKRAFPEAISAIRQARLETFWTDALGSLPQNANDEIWWELWCHSGTHDQVVQSANKLNALVAEDFYWLIFPEITVVQVYANRVTIELLLFACLGISELRRATASPTFFTEDARDDQHAWVDDLVERVTWPNADAPAVCVMDTGINRAHVLIEPALSEDDLLAVDREWGGDDHDGHGTQMGGLSLHGDLLSRLTGQAEYALAHRLESVKILPPNGFPANQPASYGPITQSAVALAEVTNAERQRTFCMAVTNEDVSGTRSTSWSASIDQICAGAMDGDDDDSPRRLFFVSAGNIKPEIEMVRVQSPNDCPIEDPAQSWNALCVGGYTSKSETQEAWLEGWRGLARPGELSPYSRTSIPWHNSKAPFKPDIVFEAGNRAVNPEGTEVLNADSLKLLTTGHEVDRLPLAAFAATSAATAQAAKFGAELIAAYPNYWPETIRALMIHSAQWTPAMVTDIDAQAGLRARSDCLRRYGYGVPSLSRAMSSAQNDLALIAESEIQPFRHESGGHATFGDCHYYVLPWPRHVLEELEDRDVRLRIVLSYFVEPNPGVSSTIDPQRYQSFGLRFSLKRSAEDHEEFLKRVNAKEQEVGYRPGRAAQDDNRWLFGPNSVSAGSVHCDEWIGPAVTLASRDMLCIRPVSGWWKNRASPEIRNRKGRYSLVLTLSTEDTEIDLYTPVQQMIQLPVDIEVDT